MWLFIVLKCNNYCLFFNKIIFDMDCYILIFCCYFVCGDGLIGYILFFVVIG